MEVINYLEGSYRDGERRQTQNEAIRIYFRLKQLMYEIDDIDDSSDEEGNKKEPKGITLYHIFNNKFLTRFFNTDNF